MAQGPRVPLTEDQDAVGEFGSDCRYESFGEAVGPDPTKPWTPPAPTLKAQVAENVHALAAASADSIVFHGTDSAPDPRPSPGGRAPGAVTRSPGCREKPRVRDLW
jgi:hypothetical protein